MTEKVTLSPRQRRGIMALMSAKDTRAAAVIAKVSERQLYRWLNDPAFVAELKAAEGAAIDQAVRRLSELSGTAIDALSSAMTDGTTATGARVQAANVALSQLLRLRELHDLEQRLAALEAVKNDTAKTDR